MPELYFREIFFGPKIMTLVSITGIGGGVILNTVIDVFESSQYMPILIFGLIAVIALFEIW